MRIRQLPRRHEPLNSALRHCLRATSDRADQEDRRNQDEPSSIDERRRHEWQRQST